MGTTASSDTLGLHSPIGFGSAGVRGAQSAAER